MSFVTRNLQNEFYSHVMGVKMQSFYVHTWSESL
jgi:hypothetical protein